jgi:hypothetical protein
LDFVQLTREPAEVVDGPRSLAVGDTAAWNVPMGRYGKDRTRPRQRGGQARPGLGVVIGLKGVQGIAVANEQRWHPAWDAFTGRGQAVTPVVRRRMDGKMHLIQCQSLRWRP